MLKEVAAKYGITREAREPAGCMRCVQVTAVVAVITSHNAAQCQQSIMRLSHPHCGTPDMNT